MTAPVRLIRMRLIAITDVDAPQPKIVQEIPFQTGGEAAVRRSSGDSFEVIWLALPIKPRNSRNWIRKGNLVEAHKVLHVLRFEENLRSLLQSLFESVRVV
jgi:hypothetical protein